jgi:hypothetical protein
LYTVTPRGAESLAQFLGCSLADLPWHRTDTRLRPNYIEHLILTNDIRLAVMRAVKETSGIELVTWHDELTLARNHRDDKIELPQSDGSIQHVTLIPDAYFVLRNSEGKVRQHFLEIDRGTETATSSDESYRTWERKIRTYKRFFSDGWCERRYGTDAGRVLTVTTSQKRLSNLLAVSEGVGAKQRFWFTTHAQATEVIIQQIKVGSDEDNKYKAIIPNILSDPIWNFARNPDQVLHVLGENFVNIHQ